MLLHCPWADLEDSPDIPVSLAFYDPEKHLLLSLS